MSTLSPLRYPGSKNKTYNYIKYLIALNNCDTYIEPFVGGGSVAIKLLLNKEWHKQKEINKNKEYNSNLLEIGFSTLFLNRTNRSGILKAGVIGGLNQTGNYKLDCRFNKSSIISKIQNMAKYKKNIKLYNKDAEDFIRQNITKTKNSLIFLDPPYYNKGPELYVNFYRKNNHISLSNTIKKSLYNKKWILTYDNSSEIENLYTDLNKIEYFLNYSAGKQTKGIEYMFFSNKINKGQVEKYLKVK